MDVEVSSKDTPTYTAMAPTTPYKPPPSTGSSTIQVVVRLRPMNDLEKKDGTLPVVTAKTQEKTVCVVKGKGKKQMKYAYSFDNVFTAFSTQEEVFEETVKPVIGDVMRGYEGTVFAYGQTGTGKTHTMEGLLSSPELYGIIPRSAQAIFEQLKQPQYKNQVVSCSYLEIYNEELRDLLDDHETKGNEKQCKLEIMEGKNGTFCRGLIEKEVTSAADVLTLMQKAQHQRIVGETKMNKASSRSHCLFTVQVHGKVALIDGDGDLEFNGKLHLVDLAGSECAKCAISDKATPDAVARERERMNINRSLLTLGRVITTLKERSEGRNVSARIPYRDSKLTRILQESLGGRCKTVIVATLSPSITAIEESLSTLNYAQSANGIINKPISSSLLSLRPNEYSAKPAEEGMTVESWQEMEMRLQYMQTQVEEAQAALARKHLQHQDLQDRAEKAEACLLENQQQLHNATMAIKSLNGSLDTETKRRIQTEKELNHTQIILKKTSLVLKATQATEVMLTSEAQSVIATLEDVIDERNEVHALLVSQLKIESDRRNSIDAFREATVAALDNIDTLFSNFCSNTKSAQKNGIATATSTHQFCCQFVSENQKLFTDVAKNISYVTNLIKTDLLGDSGIAQIIDTGSASIISDAKTAKATLTTGEESLVKDFIEIRRNLSECSGALVERKAFIQLSSSQTLKNLEAKVNESNVVITNLVQRCRSSLSKWLGAKAENTKQMELMIQQWKDESLLKSKSVFDLTSANRDSLENSIEEFETEMKHHDNISKSLEGLKSFLESSATAHVEAIDRQSSCLNTHRLNLANYYNDQVNLCSNVMNSIMSTVQSVVKTEIEKLTSSHVERFKLIDKEGLDLVANSEKMIHTARDVLENVKAKRKILSDETSIVYKNDLKAGKAMKGSVKCLEQVQLLSNAHHTLSTDFSSKHSILLSELKHLDAQNTQIAQNLENDGKSCSKMLVNAILETARIDLSKTMESTSDTFEQVSTLTLQPTCRALDDILCTRQTTTNALTSKLDHVESQLVLLKDDIVSIAKSHHETTERVLSETLSISDIHEKKLAPHFNAELEVSKENLIATLNAMADKAISACSNQRSKTDFMKQSIQDFAEEKMLCKKPISSAPKKKECKYSSNFSSTPADEIILKGYVFDSSECEIPIVSSVLACKSEMIDVDSSQESNDDDNLSIRSSSAIFQSVQSPGLKLRDLNSSHVEISSCLKSKYHSRLAMPSSAVGKKNKVPSSQRPSTASNKKMKI